MQTGVDIEQFKKDLETEDAKKEFLLLQKECEKNTRKIGFLLDPKTVFLFGNAAQKTFLKTSLPCDFVNVRHPSNAGLSKAKSEIDRYLASTKYAA